MTFFMPYQSFIVIAVVITCFMLPNIPTSDGANLPSPVIFFGWLDKRSEFRVGETATITMKFYVDFAPDQDKHLFDPHVSVQSIKGNSSFITGILSHLGDDLNKWKITFVPIMVGAYYMIITEDHFKLMDHSLHFNALPGEIYEPGCIVSWMDPMNNFVAGTKATVLILPKDAFGNNVTSDSEGQKTYNFVVSATYDNGSNVNVVDVKFQGWNKFGYLSYEFVVVTAGRLSIHIKHQNESLINSPLPLKVHPGELDVGNCVARWRTEATSFQLSSRMETFIHQRDKYGNLVPGFHDFDIQVVNKGTKLSYPIVDLRSNEVSPGIQSFSFTTAEPGDFIMIISDETTKKHILNMPYEFHVFVGYCNGTASIVNGSGITGSRAGVVTKFSVYLRDTHGLSSPIELERLEVQITVASLSLRVYPQIYPKVSVNDTQPPEMLSYGAFGHMGIASVPSFYSYNNSAENWQTRSSDFDVEYVPEKAEVHEILILCGNIPLNNGQPFLVVVNSGEPNLSMSKVVKYEPKVSTSIENYIIVQLVDSYSNPVLSQQEKLAVEIDSVKGTHSYPGGFMENYNGTYTGGYVMVDPSRYGISVSFNGAHFPPFPLEVIAYNSDIFPKAQDDRLDVWEDQSIGFYALENDFFAGVYAKIVVLQKPSHGSILQYVNLLRYTPYKQYYGSDTFTYTFVDVYGINVSASVNIDVLIIPPQFVSIPRVLQATEDTLSPKIGGFQGFMLTYSDFQDNFSVKFSAQHGAIFLSPFLMQLWDPMWNELSFSKEEGKVGNLYLTGRLEVINLAIQSLQYIGEENFYGNDNLTISTINTNGKYDFYVKIVVEPVNDAPFIDVPKFIILENEYEDGGFLIFDRQRDNFNFFVGDPDLFHFPGIETQFRVMFSVEVTSGYISAKLPAELISTTELKFENSKHWQPLITFVQISRHFTVKAKGIRFQGTINDSNTLLHQLIYFRGKHDGIMRVRVNDMGWYGCYPDCAGMKIVPLEAEATINLISRMPINAVVAHSLGSVILIESLLLSLLALILMFFTCKCVIVLLREKKKQQVQSQDLQLAELKNSNEQRLSKDSSENMIHLADNSPIHLTQSEQPLNLPKQ